MIKKEAKHTVKQESKTKSNFFERLLLSGTTSDLNKLFNLIFKKNDS